MNVFEESVWRCVLLANMANVSSAEAESDKKNNMWRSTQEKDLVNDSYHITPVT